MVSEVGSGPSRRRHGAEFRRTRASGRGKQSADGLHRQEAGRETRGPCQPEGTRVSQPTRCSPDPERRLCRSTTGRLLCSRTSSRWSWPLSTGDGVERRQQPIWLWSCRCSVTCPRRIDESSRLSAPHSMGALQLECLAAVLRPRRGRRSDGIARGAAGIEPVFPSSLRSPAREFDSSGKRGRGSRDSCHADWDLTVMFTGVNTEQLLKFHLL
ncbi:hypothetical protein Q5P01_000024 [Channa striata]|uniref:Uncharacterized protein n=1 Tax=Channa striata TaxID=64152 RepID=A0AA88IR30_CHASR|nr:hypothetical protein Q5P01_000024 [Channa striata]